jgi:serine protease Do
MLQGCLAVAVREWKARSSAASLLRMALAAALLALPMPSLAARADLLAGKMPTLAPLVREVTPSVVNISVRGRVKEDNPLYRDPLFRQFFDVPEQLEREIHATGSGVIVDAERGYVLTANHVVAQVSTVQVTVKDGRQFTARLVGRDPGTDIAVLRIDGASGLKSMAMGDSDRLEVGDFVLAVGNPFGLGQTVTFGIVSALGRTGLGKQGYEDFIQTDAPINPGNSGGGLVDVQGQLVGINTAILSPGGGNVGIGFAVPINMARRVMEQIVQSGHVRRGQIGIRLADRDLAKGGTWQASATAGAVVAEIVPGSPAEQAGIRKGDIVIAVDDVPVRSAAQLRNHVGLTPVGRLVRLTLERRGAAAPIVVEVRPTVENSTGRSAGRRE